jgi:Predicted integral membrane protein (DUF2269).
MYTYVLFVHLIAAVMGLGAAFGFPIVAKSAKTVSQAKFVLNLLHRLEILPKVGSVLLLISGIVMGILETWLFQEAWFIGSIVIYLAVQFIVAGLLPKNMKKQLEVLEGAVGEELPESYKALGKQSAKYEGISHLAAFVLILLMVFKPF